jgi:hypothetical protein
MDAGRVIAEVVVDPAVPVDRITIVIALGTTTRTARVPERVA